MSKKRAVNYELSASEVGGNQEKLIRKFCKKVKKLGIIDKYLEKAYYIKPSVTRHKKKLAKKRLSKKQNSNQ